MDYVSLANLRHRAQVARRRAAEYTKQAEALERQALEAGRPAESAAALEK